MSNSTLMSSGLFTGADVIYSYTRQQAIADGVLVDVSQMAREAGFRVPTALTRAVWEDCVAWSDQDTAAQIYQDEPGRLWDVVWMARFSARQVTGVSSMFVLRRVPRDGRAVRARLVRLKCVMGVDDDGGPCITIMLPTED